MVGIRKRERPAPNYRTGPITGAFRWVGPGVTAIVSIVLLVTYPSLPERVPTHFSGAMNADSYGPRWSVLVFVAIFSVLGGALALLARRPQLFNFPVSVTEDNAQTLYREGETMLVFVGVGVSLLYAGIGLAQHEIGGGVVLASGFTIMMGAVLIGLIRMIRVPSGRP
ncbi:hypothetical protein nbrc107696_29830 [Gordonia spumicola]|uniref:DUF1648 domain-containing protein n=1 Tax=Gordonia spumicola TaxID=589161 RepID=A0A7I9VB06_9ACTN|nr:DUF1648 domain-containing protein [Gordonia spumicola]GEE02537.1 hypothetical protein nbrc107696_29830 [Gordonia spumicola]